MIKQSYVMVKEPNLLGQKKVLLNGAPRVKRFGPASYLTLREALRYAQGPCLYVCRPAGVIDFEGDTLASVSLHYDKCIGVSGVFSALSFWCLRSVLHLIKDDVAPEYYAELEAYAKEESGTLGYSTQQELKRVNDEVKKQKEKVAKLSTLRMLHLIHENPMSHNTAWACADILAQISAYVSTRAMVKEQNVEKWKSSYTQARKRVDREVEKFLQRAVMKVATDMRAG